MTQRTRFLTQSAVIAAIYVILTLVLAPLSFGQFQLRVSESLCVLPFFTPAAVPGLFVGCLLGNFLGGAPIWDVLFGSLATLIGAVGTYLIGRMGKRPASSETTDEPASANTGVCKIAALTKWTAPVPAILANTIAVPLILHYAYGINLPIPFLALTVFAGEFLSAGVLGVALLFLLNRYRNVLFR